MKVYRITTESAEPVYRGTVDAAHAFVKASVNKTLWADTVIDELDVITDKEGVLAMLDGEPKFASTSGRRWGITPRGGLKEERE